VFLAVDDTAIQSSLVRTVLHHMLKHDHMLPVLPKDRTNKYSFHSFRKFYTTGLKQAGVSNEIIQSLLRWSAVEVIADATTCFEPHPAPPPLRTAPQPPLLPNSPPAPESSAL